MWSSCAANSHLLRTDELRVSHHFVTVHTAYAAGSWNCQTCICSPAGAWAVSYFTCTLGACIWIKKICIEFSLILWNSRWSLHGTVRELWRPGGHGFLKSYCFGSWWEAKCLWFWHFHHHEGALMGRVYSRTHFPLQCIFPTQLFSWEATWAASALPHWHTDCNKPDNSVVNFRKEKLSYFFSSTSSLQMNGI